MIQFCDEYISKQHHHHTHVVPRNHIPNKTIKLYIIERNESRPIGRNRITMINTKPNI